MKQPLFSLISALGVALLLFHGLTAAKPEKDPDQRLAVARSVKITDVKDLNSIEAYTLSVKKRNVRIVLSSTVPFSKWPEKLTEEEGKIKQAGLQLLKDVLLGKEMVFQGIDLGDVLHGDLWFQGSSGSYPWNPERPSGKHGWFTTHVNAMLIESGYTVFVKDPPRLSFATTGPRLIDRELYYASAENYAIARRKGLWKSTETSKVAKKLKDIQTSKDSK
jgi:endonuclease YncB( thermonuclease family)